MFIVLVAHAALVSSRDFDNDGYVELVVGVPHEDRGSVEDAGAVNVIRGGLYGLRTSGNQFWHQDAGLGDHSEEGDFFGCAMAVGDFDGDGFFDLAIGAEGEDVGSISDAGAVNVIYGAAGGLATAGEQLWTQDNATIASDPEVADYFGASLAAGDFNGDGFDDLAVGSPTERIITAPQVGAVVVLYGTPDGLTGSGSDWWLPSELDGSLKDYGHFGFSAAAGDLDGDGFDDLAIGARFYEVNGETLAGAVFIAHGGADGLHNAPGNDYWHQDRAGIADQAAYGDHFGYSVTIHDFDGDGYDDLAVGAPSDELDGAPSVGMVHVIYGSASGLTSTGSDMFHQDNFDSNSPAEAGDWFGFALTAGDFDDDGHADLVVGARWEDWGTTERAGMVHVLWGSAGGVQGTDALWLTEVRLQPGSTIESSEEFGTAVAAGDFDNDGHDDLAIGAPGEDLWNGAILEEGAGTVFVVYGTDAGLGLANQVFDQCSGLDGFCEAGDGFGTRLVSRPRGSGIFADGFERGDTTKWAASAP